ncbi:MAG: SDR family oxidoreductase [Verrucomicrobia bacterium]|nr:SDR family oxidoreductase [Verrucomicrobiota bacterium]MCH8525610.1 SDR family oxidoreductase [Kiritimatiellia bacterium]
MNISKTPFDLSGECALITGGGSGLGLAMAQCMAAAGARVVLVGRRESELLQAAESIGEVASVVAQDITRLEAAPELVATAEERAGCPVSILVNNAGIHVKKPVEETSAEEFQSVLSTHLCAAHALNRAVIPGMKARGHGNILYTASMASLFGIPWVVAYSAAKSAQLGVVRSMASELSPAGIRVNAIAPGWIDSAMMRKALAGDEARSNKILSRTPLGCFGEAEDIGWAAVYLVSPAAKFVTGVCLPVDGGASIGF